MGANDQYALNWSNHTNHIRKAFDTQLAGSEFVDVTLSCEGKKISAHKMLLSACSPYFYDLFRDNPCQHPIVILRDVKFQNLLDILKFMYNGEVSVATENFDSFLKTAELLQVSGLTDDESRFANDKPATTNNTPTPSMEQIPPLQRRPSNVEKKARESISKRSLNDTGGNSEESSSQTKRRKEVVVDDVKGIPVKEEEEDVIDLDEEQMQDYEGDPLEFEQNENAEGSDQFVQPTELMRNFMWVGHQTDDRDSLAHHKLEEVSDVDGEGRKLRKRCLGCYESLSRIYSACEAGRKSKRVRTFCRDCDTAFCYQCFRKYH